MTGAWAELIKENRRERADASNFLSSNLEIFLKAGGPVRNEAAS